ncbi:unnamed protein product, partial [Didymodactylos carnosus]
TRSILSEQTKGVTTSPTCGVVDQLDNRIWTNIATNRRWPRRSLTYRFKSYTSKDKIDPQKQKQIIQNAFNEWAKYSKLTFQIVCDTCKSDFEISFVTGDHGDEHPFDENDMSHAFYPTDGRIHFNDKINWTESYVETARN